MKLLIEISKACYNMIKEMQRRNGTEYMNELEEGVANGTPLKTGYWLYVKGKNGFSREFKCSECGNLLDFDGVNGGVGDANYCPNCGIMMESEPRLEIEWKNCSTSKIEGKE